MPAILDTAVTSPFSREFARTVLNACRVEKMRVERALAVRIVGDLEVMFTMRARPLDMWDRVLVVYAR